MRMHDPCHDNFNTTCRLLLIWAVVAAVAMPVHAGRFFRNGAVGGVAIDADGVLRAPTQQARAELRQLLQERLETVPGEMAAATTLRKVSLRQLERALKENIHRDVTMLPDEIRYLAGMQRIQYILVYPEQNDIVIAGPGEGWTINDAGQVVGQTTGLPVLHLEDLLVALQTVDAARQEGISCSIDPTEAGTKALQQYLAKQKQFAPRVVEEMAEVLGPQQISITGVPETSHFARVLVAADYHMKRIAMQLDESPLAELPSYLEMLSRSRAPVTNMMPRWWLACNYEPLARSEDGLTWELKGPGVKVMTEDSLIAADGDFVSTGKQSPLATEWAETMTEQYEPLSRAQAVFGELRNVMDLCIFAALIQKEGLLEQAGCDLPTMLGTSGEMKSEVWNAPKTVATQCSFIKRGRDYIITASGGVQIDSWRFASRSETSPSVGKVRDETPHVADRWWWN